jgi:hypothetical protein
MKISSRGDTSEIKSEPLGRGDWPTYFTPRITTDGIPSAEAATTPLRLTGEPRRGRRGSMKYPG